jgi:hypothetical protein
MILITTSEHATGADTCDEVICMLRFFGSDLELFVDEILDYHDAMVRSAHDFGGEHWLVVQVGHHPDRLVWVCAPSSVRALREVAMGRATMRDALRHSRTGTVEVVTIDHGRTVRDRCLCCAAIPEELLTPVDARIVVAA